MKPYVISQDKARGAWYCHKQGYIKIPVFGSIGDKSKARVVCRMMNRDLLDIKEENKK